MYHNDYGLSFADATTTVLVQDRDLDCVSAFDNDLDGIVDRLDPVEIT